MVKVIPQLPQSPVGGFNVSGGERCKESGNLLANELRYLNRDEEAVALHRQTLDDRVRMLGPDHSDAYDSGGAQVQSGERVPCPALMVTSGAPSRARRSRRAGA
ncbi:tetratricopeptide repeat protein [Streptomyces sp. NPDC057565]|uniref:tetratricopeptide repeat protein n=1 Tax=Streptomyces sp. NPDC057565 TaxID=3346169 RepID=UPI0036829F97